MNENRALWGVLLALFVLSFARSVLADDDSGVAYIKACAEALKPTDINYTNNSAVKLAYMQLLTDAEKNDNSFNTNGQAYAGVFSGGTQDQSTDESNLQNSMNFTVNETNNVALVASYLSPVSGDAFDQCVQKSFGQYSTISLRINNTDQNLVIVSVYYTPPKDNTIPFRLRVSTNGILTPANFDVPPGGLQNPTVLTIKRMNPSRNLVVTVNLETVPKPGERQGQPQGGAGVVVPPMIVTTTGPTIGRWLTSDAVESECYDRIETKQVDLVPDAPGFSFVMSGDNQPRARVTAEGHPWGLSPGPPSGMAVDPSSTPSMVTGTVTCAYPQDRWNVAVYVQGVVKAYEQKTEIDTTLPPDNDVVPIIRNYPLTIDDNTRAAREKLKNPPRKRRAQHV